MWKSGDILGAYRIDTCVSRTETEWSFWGARCGSAGFDHPVLLRALPPHLSTNDRFAAEFRRNVLSFARARHPNVVAVEDLSTIDGCLVSASQAPGGTTLDAALRNVQRRGRRPSVAQCCRVSVDVATALHEVHRGDPIDGRQPLHADVGPHCILVSPSVGACLMHAGIRGVESSRSLRRRRCDAPERAALRTADRRLDVYSLALTLWEMLTLGKARDDDEDATSAAEGLCDLDPRLVDLVMRAVSIEPDDRPADTIRFRDELVRVVPNAPSEDLTPLHVGLEHGPDPEDAGEDPTTVHDRGSVASQDRHERSAASSWLPRALEPMRAPVRHASDPAPPSPAPASIEAVVPSPTIEISSSDLGVPNVSMQGSTTTPPAEANSAPAPRLRLLDGGAQPRVLGLDGERAVWVVGRGYGVDFVLDDVDASREHFEIARDPGGGFCIFDLGSKNGLVVNGAPVHEHRLRPNDEIRAGASRLRFEW